MLHVLKKAEVTQVLEKSGKPHLQLLGIQSNIAWENPEANRLNFEKQIREGVQKTPDTDLVVLPEVFTTGFTMNLSKIDSWESRETLNWMTRLSSEFNVGLTGSVAFRFEDGTARNRSLFVRPDGSFEFYDKKHLFSLGSEDSFFEKGQQSTARLNNFFYNILCSFLRLYFPTSLCYLGTKQPFFQFLLQIVTMAASLIRPLTSKNQLHSVNHGQPYQLHR